MDQRIRSRKRNDLSERCYNRKKKRVDLVAQQYSQRDELGGRRKES